MRKRMKMMTSGPITCLLCAVFTLGTDRHREKQIPKYNELLQSRPHDKRSLCKHWKRMLLPESAEG